MENFKQKNQQTIVLVEGGIWERPETGSWSQESGMPNEGLGVAPNLAMVPVETRAP